MQGQFPVYVVKLALDVNHDGIMDLTFSGPDNTIPERPFVFWANNNYDRLTIDSDDAAYYDDDVMTATCPYTPNIATPDYNFKDGAGHRVIPCERDLQDYARTCRRTIFT